MIMICSLLFNLLIISFSTETAALKVVITDKHTCSFIADKYIYWACSISVLLLIPYIMPSSIGDCKSVNSGKTVGAWMLLTTLDREESAGICEWRYGYVGRYHLITVCRKIQCWAQWCICCIPLIVWSWFVDFVCWSMSMLMICSILSDEYSFWSGHAETIRWMCWFCYVVDGCPQIDSSFTHQNGIDLILQRP